MQKKTQSKTIQSKSILDQYFTSCIIPIFIYLVCVFYFQVTSIDIPGPVGRRLDRHLTVNIHHDMVT